MGANVGKGFEEIGKTALGGLTGALEGIPLGPEGMIAGGLSGAVGNIGNIVNAFSGSDSSVPVKPQDVANAMQSGSSLIQKAASAGGAAVMTPQMQQAIGAAASGKLNSGFAQMGQLSQAANQAVTSGLFKGRIDPAQMEKLVSPVYQTAQTLLNPVQQQQLDSSRQNAVLSSVLS